tara:strand:- start:156047 stop:156862 length:816 start_codon:yes stop_codon:yes gene_type:complete
MADEDGNCPEPPVCEECPPEGAPAWMATFSDLVTLLLTFFVLLYAMSKQDESKFKSVAGSIRKAFAGNSKVVGPTPITGKSPDDAVTMIEAQEPVEPFPIDLLTTEGLLEKYEMNRESDEKIVEMKKVLQDYNLSENVRMYQMNEGVKIRVKDKIIFEKGSVVMADASATAAVQKIIRLMRDNDWTLFIEGYAEPGESYKKDGKSFDAFDLSSLRTSVVTKFLIKEGIRPEKITSVYYGDTRAVEGDINRKVEFVLRKRDLKTPGKYVPAQ